jgi:hypothetical protein
MQNRNAIDILVSRQKRIVGAITALEVRASRERRLLRELVEEILAYGAVCEDVFYPASRRVLDVDLQRARSNLRAARNAVAQLATYGLDGAQFPSKLRRLKEVVVDHVELERRDLFPAVRRALPARELARLANEMEAYRATLPLAPRRTGDDSSATLGI